MHLLVLGAFWPGNERGGVLALLGLNAPSGAGCFLTQNGFDEEIVHSLAS